MIKISKLLIIAILAVALVAIAGTANAKPAFTVTVTVDHVQVNGVYHGVQKLISSEFQIYGYEYVLTPDGTYTVFGTITNDGDVPVTVRVGGGTEGAPEDIQYIDVPAHGSADFALNFWADGDDDVTVGYYVIYDGEDHEHWDMYDMDGIDFVNMPDNTVHTINLGPMSDAVAIFTNGVLNYNGKPIFTVGLGQ